MYLNTISGVKIEGNYLCVGENYTLVIFLLKNSKNHI